MDNENLGSLLSKHFRPIMITVGIIIAICLIILIVVAIRNFQPVKTFISVNIAPTTATVTINGQAYRNGTYELAPGQYEAQISAAGFTPKTLTIDVKQSETTPIATFLLNQKEGMAYFEKNAADLQVLATLTDPEAQEFMTSYNKKLSIRDYFPIDATYDMSAVNGTPGNDLYEQTITDGSQDSDCPLAFCLYASGYQLNEDALREALENLGYNLDDYEVIYDYEV